MNHSSNCWPTSERSICWTTVRLCSSCPLLVSIHSSQGCCMSSVWTRIKNGKRILFFSSLSEFFVTRRPSIRMEIITVMIVKIRRESLRIGQLSVGIIPGRCSELNANELEMKSIWMILTSIWFTWVEPMRRKIKLSFRFSLQDEHRVSIEELVHRFSSDLKTVRRRIERNRTHALLRHFFRV